MDQKLQKLAAEFQAAGYQAVVIDHEVVVNDDEGVTSFRFSPPDEGAWQVAYTTWHPAVPGPLDLVPIIMGDDVYTEITRIFRVAPGCEVELVQNLWPAH